MKTAMAISSQVCPLSSYSYVHVFQFFSNEIRSSISVQCSWRDCPVI